MMSNFVKQFNHEYILKLIKFLCSSNNNNTKLLFSLKFAPFMNMSTLPFWSLGNNTLEICFKEKFKEQNILFTHILKSKNCQVSIKKNNDFKKAVLFI